MSAQPNDLEMFLGKPKAKRKTRGICDSAWHKLLAEATERMESGDWSGTAPRVFVALYAILHGEVYGVDPVELNPIARLHATGAAMRLLENQFGGHPEELAAFMRWIWCRENDRERWRRENQRETRPIGWALMFGGGLLTDWRLNQHRTRIP